MPDANGRIKGISTTGISNHWLDVVTYTNQLKREMERLKREEKVAPVPQQAPPANPAPHEEIPYGTWGDPITIGGSCGD